MISFYFALDLSSQITYCYNECRIKGLRVMPAGANKTKPTYWFIFQNNDLIILKNDPKKSPLPPSTAVTIKDTFLRQYRLGSFNGFEIYCGEIHCEACLPETLTIIPLRKALELLGDHWYSFAVKAYTIINWDKNHHYCGRCRQPTEHLSNTFERICQHCKLSFYPRISPSIIVRINKQDQLLMARGPHFPKGIYGLIAGFIEAGESIEEAVHREVAEEVGIKIKALKYLGSQSWPFPDSLMIAFSAEYDSGELVIDTNEIEDAGWYHYANLPGCPSSRISISRKLIDDFIAERSQKTLK